MGKDGSRNMTGMRSGTEAHYLHGLDNLRKIITSVEIEVDQIRREFFCCDTNDEEKYETYLKKCNEKFLYCNSKLRKCEVELEPIDSELRLVSLLNRVRELPVEENVDPDVINFLTEFWEHIKLSNDSTKAVKDKYILNVYKRLKKTCGSYNSGVVYCKLDMTRRYTKDVEQYNTSIVSFLRKFDNIVKSFTACLRQELFTDTNFSNRILISCDQKAFPILRLIPDLSEKLLKVCAISKRWIDKDETYVHDISNYIREKRHQTRQIERDLQSHKEKQTEMTRSCNDAYTLFKTNKRQLMKMESELKTLEQQLATYSETKKTKVEEKRQKEGIVGFLDISISQTKKNYTLQLKRSRLMKQLHELEESLRVIEKELTSIAQDVSSKVETKTEIATQVESYSTELYDPFSCQSPADSPFADKPSVYASIMERAPVVIEPHDDADTNAAAAVLPEKSADDSNGDGGEKQKCESPSGVSGDVIDSSGCSSDKVEEEDADGCVGQSQSKEAPSRSLDEDQECSEEEAEEHKMKREVEFDEALGLKVKIMDIGGEDQHVATNPDDLGREMKNTAKVDSAKLDVGDDLTVVIIDSDGESEENRSKKEHELPKVVQKVKKSDLGYISSDDLEGSAHRGNRERPTEKQEGYFKLEWERSHKHGKHHRSKSGERDKDRSHNKDRFEGSDGKGRYRSHEKDHSHRSGSRDRSRRKSKSADRDERSYRRSRSPERDERSRRRSRSIERDDRSRRRSRSIERDDRTRRRSRSADRDDRSRQRRSRDTSHEKKRRSRSRSHSPRYNKDTQRRSRSKGALREDPDDFRGTVKMFAQSMKDAEKSHTAPKRSYQDLQASPVVKLEERSAIGTAAKRTKDANDFDHTKPENNLTPNRKPLDRVLAQLFKHKSSHPAPILPPPSLPDREPPPQTTASHSELSFPPPMPPPRFTMSLPSRPSFQKPLLPPPFPFGLRPQDQSQNLVQIDPMEEEKEHQVGNYPRPLMQCAPPAGLPGQHSELRGHPASMLQPQLQLVENVVDSSGGLLPEPPQRATLMVSEGNLHMLHQPPGPQQGLPTVLQHQLRSMHPQLIMNPLLPPPPGHSPFATAQGMPQLPSATLPQWQPHLNSPLFMANRQPMQVSQPSVHMSQNGSEPLVQLSLAQSHVGLASVTNVLSSRCGLLETPSSINLADVSGPPPNMQLPPLTPNRASPRLQNNTSSLSGQERAKQQHLLGPPPRLPPPPPPPTDQLLFKVPMPPPPLPRFPGRPVFEGHMLSSEADSSKLSDMTEVVDMDVSSPLSDEDNMLSAYSPPHPQHLLKELLPGLIDRDKHVEKSVSFHLDTKDDFDNIPSSAVDLDNLSKKQSELMKENRKERVVEEVKMAIKPHYVKGRINKEQYKEIMRKAVPKICHSKSGHIHTERIRGYVEQYVNKVRQADKYKMKKQHTSSSQKPSHKPRMSSSAAVSSRKHSGTAPHKR